MAKQTSGESDGAKREREIRELEEQWASPQKLRDNEKLTQCEEAYGSALDAATLLLEDGDEEFAAGVKMILDESDADAAAFCRWVAGNMADGEVKGWVSRLADALERCAESADELNGTCERYRRDSQ